MKEDTLSSAPMDQGSSLYVIVGHVGEQKTHYIQETMLSREDGCGFACKVCVAWSWEKKKRAGLALSRS